ncbi:hypothetical protein [Streptomyces sp. NPDC050428]|uniref:hypothetical protein n=1 Tax=Streptomyces sp. NPDC050428 TaxID=3155757 RepID=UPI0034182C8E
MGKRRRHTAMLCAIVVMGVGGISGCGDSGGGGSEKDAKGADEVQRMSAALTTLKGYDTVRMNGRYLSTADVDLQADREGNCVGTLDFADGGIIEFIHVGGEGTWSRYDDANLASSRRLPEQIGPDALALHDKAAKKARGKYVESSPDEMEASETEGNKLPSLCDLDTAFAEVPDSVSGVKPRNPETKDGKRVVGLVQQPEGDAVTVYVPVTGDPVPLRVEFEIDDEPFELDITDPDKPLDVTPPPASQTVTSAEVTGLFPEIPEHMQGE